MYAEVVVLTYQAPDIGTFTYEIPKTLQGRVKTGQLVEVPFGKRTPQAIVLNTRSDLAVESRSDLDIRKIKAINSIVFEQPILLPYQIELLKWMAGYYFAPMVNCLEAILPEFPSKSFIVNGKWAKPQQAIHNSQFTKLWSWFRQLPESRRLCRFLKAPKTTSSTITN